MEKLGGTEFGQSVTAELEERTALYTALADRLLQGEALEDAPRRAHLLKLLETLMGEATIASRRAVVERARQMASPPKDIALLLARDRADVSAPLLREAPFSQNELIALVSRTGPEHHIEIAKRADLTLDVWLALARAAARRARTTPESGMARPPEPVRAEPDRPAPPPAPEDVPVSSGLRTGHATDHPPPRMPATPPLPPAPTVSSPRPLEPLVDASPDSWRFETDREGRIRRLSPNAALAFGKSASALIGEQFAAALQAHAAAPAVDEIGEAMARRAALRDIVVETMADDEPPRRWRVRGQPRFSFPDGRFEGYSGTVRDLDRAAGAEAPPRDAAELLDRLARAADRLALVTASPELEDYARTVRDCIEAMKTMPMTIRIGDGSAKRQDEI